LGIIAIRDFIKFTGIISKPMNRRIAIKQMGLITAGAMLLPACVKSARELTIALSHISITGDQEFLVGDIVSCIIPTTDTPGAGDLNVHHFVLRMVDDCYSPEDQQNFLAGLIQVDQSAEKMFGKSFEDCTIEEKTRLISSWTEEKKDSEEETETTVDGKPNQLPAFFAITKRHTVQGYLSSEYVLTNALPYTMAPGGFKGCVEIKDMNDIQTVIG
jgi:hypothetical protein